MGFEEELMNKHETIPSKEEEKRLEEPEGIPLQGTTKEDIELEDAVIASELSDLEKIKKLEEEAGFDLHLTEDKIHKEIETKELIMETEKQILQARDELIARVSRPEYLEKLKQEYSGDEERAKEMQVQRVNNLKSVRISVKSMKDVNMAYGDIGGNVSGEVSGFYNRKSHELCVAYDYSASKETARHELIHAATRGVDDISANTKRKLGGAYLNEGSFDRYFSNPAEMIARKGALEDDMERLGIKKYDEKFNEEHYSKLIEAYEQDKLSEHSVEFIERIKLDHLKDILDKIAKNEFGDDVTVV